MGSPYKLFTALEKNLLSYLLFYFKKSCIVLLNILIEIHNKEQVNVE